MTQVNFLFLRLIVSETQTDRQTDRQDKYIYIYMYINIIFKFKYKSKQIYNLEIQNQSIVVSIYYILSNIYQYII